MEVSAISSIISQGRKGTRIPESLLGLPERHARLSMDPISPVSKVRTSRVSAQNTQTNQTADTVSLTATLRGLINGAAGTTGDDTFRSMLLEAIDAQTTTTENGTSSLLSDPEYYRNLMMLNSLSSNLLSDSLTSYGTT